MSVQFGVHHFMLYSAPMDMRKGINSLVDIILGELGRDPRCNDAFVFIGKRRDRLKVVAWSAQGYWLCQHRLEKGRFRLPTVVRKDGQVCAVALSSLQWQALLEGVIIEKQRRLPRFLP